MADTNDTLRQDLLQAEFSEGYAESFLDAWIATQIKVLREQEPMTQAALAAKIGTKQTVISRYENVNYSAWSIKTLKKLARAFRVRLRVSFETYGSLLHELNEFDREKLTRVPRERDPELLQGESPTNEHLDASEAAVKYASATDALLRSIRRPMASAVQAGNMEMNYEPSQRSTSAVDLAFRYDRTQPLRLGSFASSAGNQCPL